MDHVSWKVALSAAVVVVVVITIPIIVITKGKKEPEKPITPPTLPDQPVVVIPVVAVPPGRRVELTVVSGNERGRVDKASLSPKVVVGRDRKCDVSYPDDSEMSARHFELSSAGEFVEVQDLGSTNGTLLNGARLVTQQRIEDGDWIRAGLTEIRITFGA